MATLTSNLSLTKPAFNEYFDSWGVDVVNVNMDLIDAAVGALNTLTASAAGAFGTINLRFIDAETDIAALDDLREIDKGWTEGVPAVDTFLGPDDAVIGQDDVGRIFHSYGLQLAELTGVAPTLNVVSGLATMLKRVKQGILVAGGADLIAIGTPTTSLNVNPAADFELLVGGKYAIIRAETPDQQLPATGAAAATRFYLVATAVGWNDLAGGAANGATSGSTFTGTFNVTDARPGDLLDITAGASNVNLGLYVINTMGAGTLTVRGTFPSNLSGHTFQFRRRHWPTLALKKWGVEIDSIVDGQCYFGTTLIGTVLGHARMKAASAVFDLTTDPAVQYSPGLSYDTGWVSATGFFDGATSLNGGERVRTLPLPNTPSNFTFLWSPTADGLLAVPVPHESLNGANGIRQWWNLNALSVLNPTGAETLQDSAGNAVAQAAVNAGYFRIIAKE